MRRFRNVVAAILLAIGFGIFTQAIVMDACAGLTPANWFLWWWNDCDKGDPTGGGGSGAS